MPLDVPCGQCIGCRLERSRQWAIRCVHEASLYEKNCFITLTYSPENMPKDSSLVKRDFQLFMKKLRKRFGSRIRFFHCGEYGDLGGRPHYHACLFNFDFPDKEKQLLYGRQVTVSKMLEQIWGKGYCVLGDVTFESAAYVARYITKKITGAKALEHYNTIDYDTGEVLAERLPEYTLMSRRPGIGADWFKQFHKEIYGYDSVVIKGREMKPPKFYDSKYELLNPADLKRVKRKRVEKAEKFVKDDSGERLYQREKIKLLNEKRRIKSYEQSGIRGL